MSDKKLKIEEDAEYMKPDTRKFILESAKARKERQPKIDYQDNNEQKFSISHILAGGVLFILAFAGIVSWGVHFSAGLLLGLLWIIWAFAWAELDDRRKAKSSDPEVPLASGTQ